MLQTLRNNTRTILWIVVAAFVLFIILVWGADLQVGRAAKGTVGSVNGREIPYTLYQRQMTNDLQNLRAQGQRNPTFEEERQTIEQTWRSIVDQIIISQEAKKNRLPISDEEVVFWVKSNPPPQLAQNPAFLDSVTGQFNQARYEEALRSSPEQFLWYEELMRVQLPMDKLQRNVLGSAKVSEGEVDAYVRDRYEQLRMSYLWVDPRKFPDPGPPVTEAEARAYYDSHAEEFAGKERIQLVVARIAKVPSPEDKTAALSEMQTYAETIKSGEATFASLAESFSEDPFAAAGGDRGRAMRRTEIEPALAEQVFTLPLRQVSDPPIQIDNRLVLIQVTADTLIDGEPARRFSAIERRLQPGAERLTELRESARAIAAAAGRSGLAAAAKAAGAEADTTAFVERQSFTPLLMGARDALELAFELPAGRVGNLVETENEFILYQVLAKHAAGPIDFAEAVTRAERGAARARQHELARSKANAMFEAVEGRASLAGAAEAETLTVRDSGRFTRKGAIPEVGRDPELVAAAFALTIGSTSGLIETEKGYFVVRPDSLIPPTPADLERYKTSARQVLLNERRNQTYEAWLADLRSKASIKDHREQFN